MSEAILLVATPNSCAPPLWHSFHALVGQQCDGVGSKATIHGHAVSNYAIVTYRLFGSLLGACLLAYKITDPLPRLNLQGSSSLSIIIHKTTIN